MGLVAARVRPRRRPPAPAGPTFRPAAPVQPPAAATAAAPVQPPAAATAAAPQFRSRGVGAVVSAVSRGSAARFRARFLDAFSKRGSVSRSRAPRSRGALDQPG